MDLEKLANSLGHRLRKAREAKGLTQQDVIARTSLSNSSYGYLSRVEDGQHLPSLSTLLEINEALGLRPLELLEILNASLLAALSIRSPGVETSVPDMVPVTPLVICHKALGERSSRRIDELLTDLRFKLIDLDLELHSLSVVSSKAVDRLDEVLPPSGLVIDMTGWVTDAEGRWASQRQRLTPLGLFALQEGIPYLLLYRGRQDPKEYEVIGWIGQYYTEKTVEYGSLIRILSAYIAEHSYKVCNDFLMRQSIAALQSIAISEKLTYAEYRELENYVREDESQPISLTESQWLAQLF